MDNHGRHGRRRHHHIISFNPSWCFRPSQTKDTAKRSSTPDDRIPTTTTSFPSHAKQKRLLRFGSISVAALSSPRIGCMGQIKRRRPSSRDSASTSSSSSPKSSSSSSRGRSKLVKFTMDLLRRSVSPPVSSSRVGVEDRSVLGGGVRVVDMDPPLPVVRRVAPSDENWVSLWERRYGGGEVLRGLQIQLPQQQLCAVV